MRAPTVFVAAFLVATSLAAPAPAQQVGVAAAVNQSAVGTPPTQKPRTMVLGASVIHNEKIETNSIGLLQILLADGTSFTVGPNSAMSIDSFVYDPDANTAKVVATLAKGTFRFIGGRTSKSPDGATINTPVGTVGIRGGIGDFDFSHRNGTPSHIDMLFGNSITLTQGGRQLGRLYAAGYSIALGAGGAAGVIKTPPGWTQALQRLLSGADRPGRRGSGGGGGAGAHAATQIASALAGNNGTGGRALPLPGTQALPALGGLTLLAGSPPPLPSSVLPNPGGLPGRGTPGMPGSIGNANWGEINNSSLAGVSATYTGNYNLTTGFQNLPPEITSPTGSVEGPFSLDYAFGSHNGQGQMTFMDQAGTDTLTVPVTPVTTGNGPATFHGGYSETVVGGNYAIPTSLTVDGGFINTTAGVGHGVSGTIGVSVGPVPVNNSNVSFSANGTFNGSLDHTTP